MGYGGTGLLKCSGVWFVRRHFRKLCHHSGSVPVLTHFHLSRSFERWVEITGRKSIVVASKDWEEGDYIIITSLIIFLFFSLVNLNRRMQFVCFCEQGLLCAFHITSASAVSWKGGFFHWVGKQLGYQQNRWLCFFAMHFLFICH